MIYSNFTTYAVSSFTRRNCIRFTEMAYVIVAVFDSGRPQFISKKALHAFVVRQECLNDGKLQAEWKIGVLAGVAKKEKVAKLSVNPQAAYDLAKSLGCNIREDWWTPVNQGKEKIILRRPTDEQLEVLAAADANWDIKWGVYEIAA